MLISIGPIDHHSLLAYCNVDNEIMVHYDLSGSDVWTDEEREILSPPPDMTVSEWADENRVLLRQTSRRSGPWQTSFTPYLRAIMDSFKDKHIRHIVVCAGTQLGKTETIYNIIGYTIDIDPRSIMLVMPREEDSKGISRSRVQPMINACQPLRDKKPRNSNLYQTLEMHFPGMMFYIVASNSAAALSQKPVPIVLRDEIDKYPEKVGKDADPLSLSEERTKQFWDIRKVVDVSSPTIAGFGILKQLDTCHVIYELHAPCPHCNSLLKLSFKNIDFEDNKKDPNRIMKAKMSAVYVCEHCGGIINDSDRPWMIANCEYVPDREVEFQPEKIGFWLSSLYSPMLSWGDIVEKFLEAEIARDEKGDLGPLQNFINGWLAEEWKVSVKASTKDKILSRRNDIPPLVVPAETMAITAGIDVQKHGFWFTVWAWTKKLESHLVHYGWLNTWADVSQLCFDTAFEVIGFQQKMGIWRVAMDTGGGRDSSFGDEWTKTEEIVQWLRDNSQGIVFGVKGMSTNPTGVKVRPSILDKMPGKNGGQIPGGITIYLVDTYMMKETFFWRLSQVSADDPQKMTLHSQTGEDFAKQILAEEKQRSKNGKMEYVQVHKDNHLLDASVYAHAAADVQWMGGVSILNNPQFALHIPVVRKKTVRQSQDNSTGGGIRQNVRGYRPAWLQNRRR